ncbi:MAG: ABC transporter permease [Rhodobacteraceae bacterium]|nr:ABC transporter permease [Paracoccaceae bacterium]
MSIEDTRELSEVHTRHSTFRAISALILREMSTTYGRSPGGYIWAILEPAAGVALLTAVFSAGFRTPPLGTSFPLFYASGLLIFMTYLEIAQKMAATLNFSRALFEYPRVTFADALIARLLLNTMTQILVHLILFTGIFVVLSIETVINFQAIMWGYATALSLAVGVGILNSCLFVAYPIWQTIWAVTNRPLFIISCLFYTFESVPQPYRDYLWWNPLVHVVGFMRDGFYPYYQPTYTSAVYPIMLGTVLTIVGLFLLKRYHRDILDK